MPTPDRSKGMELSVSAARAAIAAVLTPITDCDTLPLDQALGRVLAEDLISPIAVPAHDNSAMDGWALRGADLGASAITLNSIGTALAGHPYSGSVGIGQCVRIMTGAVVPAGADTVVMQEEAQQDGNNVRIPGTHKSGQNVRRAGEDIARGAVALRSGTLLRPQHLGLAASLGLARLRVHRRARVAVFSTGDELRQPGEDLVPGAIYDSNRHVLAGMLARLGCETRDLGVVRDEPARLEAALREAMSWADAIVTSGGVSTGDMDFTRALLAKLGEVTFCNIAMRPCRPMAFGRLKNGERPCVLFGLPGNPVAAAVSFTQFVRGALLQMCGCTDTALPLLQARAHQPMKKKPGRTEYQRGILERDDQGMHVRLTGAQGSGMLSSLCQADCLVVLQHDQGDVSAGDWVDVLPFEGLV